jgi:hypothetical protein
MSSLTGKNNSNSLHLSGKNNKITNSKDIPFEIISLKTLILTQFLLPLLSNQWDTLSQNILLLDTIKTKIHSYHFFSAWREELSIYSDLLNLLEKVLSEHRQLEEIEKKSIGLGSNEEVMSFVYKTTAIRLKPEYEIYNVILGKPQREKKETYKEEVLQEIRRLLVLENITFPKIKDFLMKKYAENV